MVDTATIALRVDTSGVSAAAKAFDKLDMRANNVGQNIENSFSQLGNKIGQLLERPLDNAARLFDNFKSGVISSFQKLGDVLNNTLSKALSGILSGDGFSVSNLVSSLGSSLSNFGSSQIKDFASQAFGKLSSFIKDKGASLLSSAFGGISSLFSSGSGILGGIGSALSGVLKPLTSLTSLIPGIPGLITGGVSALVGVVISKLKKPRAETGLVNDDGFLSNTGFRTKNGASSKAISSIFSSASSVINQLLEATGARIEGDLGGSRILEKKGKLFVRINNISQRFGKDLESATGFIIKEILKSDNTVGLSDSIKTVLNNTLTNNVKKVIENINFAQTYDAIINDVQAETLTEVEKAIESIRDQFSGLAERAEQLGLAVEPLLQAEIRELDKLRQSFVDGIDRQIASLTNNPAFAFQDLIDAQASRQSDAVALGLDPTELARLERLSLLERVNLLKQFDQSSLDILSQSLDAQELLYLQSAQAVIGLNDAISSQIDKASDLSKAYQNAGADISKILNDLRFSNISPLSQSAQLQQARSQFDAISQSASAGNIDALQQLPDIAQRFLELSRNVNASGTIFQSDFANVENILRIAEQQSNAQSSFLSSEVTILTSIKSELEKADPNTELLTEQLNTLRAISNGLLGQSVVNISSAQSAVGANNLADILQNFVTSQTTGDTTLLSNILLQLQQGNESQTVQNQQIWDALNQVATAINSSANDNSALQDQLATLLVQIA